MYHGWASIVAESGPAKELDVYLREPSYVTEDGALEPLTAAEGVLIPRSSIVSVVRFRGDAPAADEPAG